MDLVVGGFFTILILLLIMMSDLRATKSKRTISTVNKSNTTVSLPGITHPIKYCRTDRMPIKQSYLDTINNISQNVQYGDKNVQYLTKQQSKLKEMLKKMNSDTLHMIDLVKPRKNVPKASKEEMVVMTDRQIDNSKKNISIMQAEIEKLEAKYNKIIEQMQEEELINKIRETKSDIESLRNGNIGIKFNIDKDGKEIIKEYSDGYDHKLSILENDNALFGQKFQKLTIENNKAVQQNSKLQTKMKEYDAKIQSYEDEYQKAKSSLLSQTINRNLEATFKQKRYQSEALKKKMDFQNNHLQYRYYKLLKELEAQKTTCDGLSARQEDLTNRITKSKESIIQFENLHENLRKQREQKNRSVLLFLQKERKNRQLVAEKEPIMVYSLFTPRQQSIPHTVSLCEPIQNETPVNPKNSEQTRKWQSETLQQHSDKKKDRLKNNREEILIQHDKNERQQIGQVHFKEEVDNSTAQLKQKRSSTKSNKEQVIIKIEAEHINPQP